MKQAKQIDFSHLEINLVSHDTSSAGLPAYIEVHLGHTPKDRGSLVLDLGNYIYGTTGIAYEMCPEFRGRGKQTTVRWFVSWRGLEPIRLNILKAFGKEKMIKVEQYLPFEFRSLIIQNPARGVVAQERTQAGAK